MQERLITFSCLMQCREAWSTSLTFAIVNMLALFMLIPPFESILLSWLIPTGDAHCLMGSPSTNLIWSCSLAVQRAFSFTPLNRHCAMLDRDFLHHCSNIKDLWLCYYRHSIASFCTTSTTHKGPLTGSPLECLLIPTTTFNIGALFAYRRHLTTSLCSLALQLNIFPNIGASNTLWQINNIAPCTL